jgi:hypothetical protein
MAVVQAGLGTTSLSLSTYTYVLGVSWRLADTLHSNPPPPETRQPNTVGSTPEHALVLQGVSRQDSDFARDYRYSRTTELGTLPGAETKEHRAPSTSPRRCNIYDRSSSL